MKRIFLILFLFSSCFAYANPRGLEKYVPEYSFIVIGADFAQLRDNQIFQSMQQNGQIWSYEDDSEISNYFRLLKIDPRRDIRAFVFSKYVNAYGTSGKLHIFEMMNNFSGPLEGKQTNTYLNMPLYRIDPADDRYAALITPSTLALGGLNEVKMAVDLAQGKLKNMSQNLQLNSLFQKLPQQAGVWGIALPLSRRKAADANAKQSTNAILEGFQSYYFYGIPTRTQANSHFYGQTADEKQASLLSAFMVGTLTVAKFRVDESVADMLDAVNIQHDGRNIHVSAVVTKEMVDAYFHGKLGVD